MCLPWYTMAASHRRQGLEGQQAEHWPISFVGILTNPLELGRIKLARVVTYTWAEVSPYKNFLANSNYGFVHSTQLHNKCDSRLNGVVKRDNFHRGEAPGGKISNFIIHLQSIRIWLAHVDFSVRSSKFSSIAVISKARSLMKTWQRCCSLEIRPRRPRWQFLSKHCNLRNWATRR